MLRFGLGRGMRFLGDKSLCGLPLRRHDMQKGAGQVSRSFFARIYLDSWFILHTMAETWPRVRVLPGLKVLLPLEK